MNFEEQRDNFTISTNPDRLDPGAIHAYLSRSYWASKRPPEIVQKSLLHSLCFGVYENETSRQIGLARVITDYATYAYLCDVYILEEYRGQGLGKWLLRSALAHPELQTVRRWSLVTRDAHELYRPFGFENLTAPERYMELINPNL